MDWRTKRSEYEARKARVKAYRLTHCAICGDEAKGQCLGCRATTYCSVDCQKVDWLRGHRAACKKVQERAAESARAAAPAPARPPPEEVFYGPAPRSRADEARARIAAEHEAARARREAHPEPEPLSARYGSRCPICLEDWDVNEDPWIRACCVRIVCGSCAEKVRGKPCCICRAPYMESNAVILKRLHRYVDDEVPEAICHLANAYRDGSYGLVKSQKKATKLYTRAVELGNVDAMMNLAFQYNNGRGVKLDRKKACRFDLMAARRGHAKAQWNLGLTLQKEDSLFFFRQAAAQGHLHSICYLKSLGLLESREENEGHPGASAEDLQAKAAEDLQAKALASQLHFEELAASIASGR